MKTSSPRTLAWSLFLLAAVALIMALRGYLNLGDDHGGGNAVAYLFEVGIPALLCVGLLWQGTVLWRKKDDAA